MKIRIGVSTGVGPLDPAEYGELANEIVTLGFDSIWLPEVLSVPSIEPYVGLAWAGATNTKLKLGTTALVPGRNLIRFARQLATLDALSAGRLLLVLVPGIPRGAERSAVGVDPSVRGNLIDEALPVLRALWAGEVVSHHGPAGHFDEVSIAPLPAQNPLEVWLGGTAPAALERCGRLSDGWLPALCTPEEVAAGRVVVERAANEAGRTISPEHFGVSLAYASAPLNDQARGALALRTKGRPIEDLVPVGIDALRKRILEFIDVGFSKFVVRALVPGGDWRGGLRELAHGVLDLQT